jgi:DNA end-binding protein Ku
VIWSKDMSSGRTLTTYLLLTDADLDSVKVESSSVMTIEKFVDASSIDPIYYDAAYYVAPDGEAGRDVYAVLRQAVAETGRLALSRVVIGQREKTIALRAVEGGIVAHTLDEQRDINDAKPVLGDAADIGVDREMVQLAKELINRQTSNYDPSDLEDRYETRLRAMIEAKLKGEGIETGAAAEPDLMAALKKSLAQAEGEPKAGAGAAPAAAPPAKQKRAAGHPAKAPRKRA